MAFVQKGNVLREIMKGDVINLVSRVGTVNSFLTEIEENVYEWNAAEGLIFQISFDKNDIYMLDPDSGPAIYTGFEFGNKTVVEIKKENRDGFEKYIVYAK